jgi:uncharacterized membrane protein
MVHQISGRHNRQVSTTLDAPGPHAEAASPSEEQAVQGRRREWIPFALASLALVLYGAVTWLRWNARVKTSWDLAIFTQAVDGYARFAAPIVDIKDPGVHQLGDHFSPILATIAPFYRIFPTPLTVQFAQVVLITLSVFVIAKTAVDWLGRRAGLLVGLAYTLSFGLQAAVDVDFHEYAFAPPIIAMIGRRYLQGRWLSAALWSLPLFAVKEDMGLVVGALGIVLFLKGARKIGALLSVAALIELILVVFVVMPALNPRGRYDYLGVATDDDGGLLQVLALLPVHVVWPPEKLLTLLVSTVVVGFLCFRSPFMLLSLPLFVERFASPYDIYWTAFWQYSMPIMPIVFIAAIEVLRSLQNDTRPIRRLTYRAAPIVMVVICLALVPSYGANMWIRDALLRDDRAEAVDAAVEAIPAGATVQADDIMSVHVVSDHETYHLHWPDQPLVTWPEIGAEYIVLDNSFWSNVYDVHGESYARELNPNHRYEKVYEREEIVVLKRLDG